MSKSTELVSLTKDRSDDPRFAVCFARGNVFRQEGHFHRVEVGSRTVVHRALCAIQYYGKRCLSCPNQQVTLFLRPKNEP